MKKELRRGHKVTTAGSFAPRHMRASIDLKLPKIESGNAATPPNDDKLKRPTTRRTTNNKDTQESP